MIKRTGLLVASVGIAVAIGVAGCSSKTASSDSGQPVKKESGNGMRYTDTQYISVFTSAPGGGMYNIAAAIAPIWDEKLNVKASIGPGGSFSNFQAVAKGEATIGFSHQCMHYWANHGEAPFKEKVEGLSTLSTLFPATVQAFTHAKNTTIKTVADIKDKRIGLGPQGSALNIFVLDYLQKIYGVTPETIRAAGGSINFMSDSDMSSAISDRIIDIGFGLGTYPKSSIQEIEKSPGIRMVPFGDDLRKYLAVNPGWGFFKIPANTYAGQTEEYPTATSWAVMTVPNSMNEELAYRLVKSFWENREGAANASMEIKSFMTLENATAAAAGAPLHPGAARYYREKGILK